MPKVYSDEEKKAIIERLKREANILMQEKGVKKTTVDELVKRAGIPKGTFYLFYPSKEMLLWSCASWNTSAPLPTPAASTRPPGGCIFPSRP